MVHSRARFQGGYVRATRKVRPPVNSRLFGLEDSYCALFSNLSNHTVPV